MQHAYSETGAPPSAMQAHMQQRPAQLPSPSHAGGGGSGVGQQQQQQQGGYGSEWKSASQPSESQHSPQHHQQQQHAFSSHGSFRAPPGMQPQARQPPLQQQQTHAYQQQQQGQPPQQHSQQRHSHYTHMSPPPGMPSLLSPGRSLLSMQQAQAQQGQQQQPPQQQGQLQGQPGQLSLPQGVPSSATGLSQEQLNALLQLHPQDLGKIMQGLQAHSQATQQQQQQQQPAGPGQGQQAQQAQRIAQQQSSPHAYSGRGGAQQPYGQSSGAPSYPQYAQQPPPALQQQGQYGGSKAQSPHYAPARPMLTAYGRGGEEQHSGLSSPISAMSPPPMQPQQSQQQPATYVRSSGHLLSPTPQPQGAGAQGQQQQAQQQYQPPPSQGHPTSGSDAHAVAQLQHWQQQQLSRVQSHKADDGSSGAATPLTRQSSMADTPMSSHYPSPLSSVHSLSSPSASSSSVRSMGLHSNYSSARSSTRSLSGLGSLNPAAASFEPTSNPSSPAALSSPSRYMQGRAASSTPTHGFASASASPPSSSSTLSSRGVEGSMMLPSPQHGDGAVLQQHAQIDTQLQMLGLPAAPFDPREIDAQIARETPEHAAYIFSFRVHVCQAYLEGNCPNDAYNCFQTHARLPRRRKPLLQHMRFTYIPTRCRYVIEEKECPQGVHCRFSHVTEEVIYHPSKFRTQLCSHPIDKDGRCAGYGAHCAKAHGPLDLRQPVFESTDESNASKMQSQDFFDFVCPPDKRDIERLYYMFVYKTKKCVGFPFSCSCDGLEWHRPEERRRGPIIKYAPMACPNVKPYLNAEWGRPNIDCSGRFKPKVMKNGQMVPQEAEDGQWDCEYAHTLLELMYHPQVYKTGLCDHFDESNPNTWRCVWKRRCAHSHGRDDVRTKEEATEAWKQHLMAALPHATTLPTMLNRLLTAGATAFESLSGTGASMSKSRGGSSASPSQMAHRRSISSSSGAMRGGGSAGGSMVQAISGRLSHQSFQASPLLVTSPHAYSGGHGSHESASPHSQPATPMLHSRTPVLLPSAAAGSHSPTQGSPRSLLGGGGGGSGGGGLRPSPSMSEGRTPLGLSGGLGLGGGFFSGADSNVWAPSPKSLTPSNAGQSSMMALPPQSSTAHGRVERFSFETDASGERDLAAAWAASAHMEMNGEAAPQQQRGADKGAHPMASTSYISPHGMQHSQSSLLLLSSSSADVAASVPSPPTSPAPLLSAVPVSPSPDSLLPALVANTALWPSPQTAAGSPEEIVALHVSGIRTQMSAFLQCAHVPADATGSHMLASPVSTPCCGAALCKACIEPFLAQVKSKSKQSSESGSAAGGEELKKPDAKEAGSGDEHAKSASNGSMSGGRCPCGRDLRADDVQRLRDAPVLSNLHQLCEWMRQMESTNGVATSAGASRSPSSGDGESGPAAKVAEVASHTTTERSVEPKDEDQQTVRA